MRKSPSFFCFYHFTILYVAHESPQGQPILVFLLTKFHLTLRQWNHAVGRLHFGHVFQLFSWHPHEISSVDSSISTLGPCDLVGQTSTS